MDRHELAPIRHGHQGSRSDRDVVADAALSSLLVSQMPATLAADRCYRAPAWAVAAHEAAHPYKWAEPGHFELLPR